MPSREMHTTLGASVFDVLQARHQVRNAAETEAAANGSSPAVGGVAYHLRRGSHGLFAATWTLNRGRALGQAGDGHGDALLLRRLLLGLLIALLPILSWGWTLYLLHRGLRLVLARLLVVYLASRWRLSAIMRRLRIDWS